MQKYANLVELEKCCQTHIFLQNFVLIQPRTSPPKICKNFANFPKFANPNPKRAAGLQRAQREVAVRLVGAEGHPDVALVQRPATDVVAIGTGPVG